VADYIVQSQIAAGGMFGDTSSGETLTQSRTSKDPNVSRYRPTIVNAEHGETGKWLQRRADWEATVRAGRANRVRYTVEGWEHSRGLWEPNTTVHVTDWNRECDDDLLIVTCTYTRSNEEGTRTALELTSPDAYKPQPVPMKTKRNEFDF
jgi:prophage tail gpP-like protein